MVRPRCKPIFHTTRKEYNRIIGKKVLSFESDKERGSIEAAKRVTELDQFLDDFLQNNVNLEENMNGLQDGPVR